MHCYLPRASLVALAGPRRPRGTCESWARRAALLLARPGCAPSRQRAGTRERAHAVLLSAREARLGEESGDELPLSSRTRIFSFWLALRPIGLVVCSPGLLCFRDTDAHASHERKDPHASARAWSGRRPGGARRARAPSSCGARPATAPRQRRRQRPASGSLCSLRRSDRSR